MAQILVLYRKPKDPAAFDRYYHSTHIPLANKIPGLKKYEISDGPVRGPAGLTDYHLVAMLHFASMADVEAAFASPEGKAAGADLANFADGGSEIMFFDDKPA